MRLPLRPYQAEAIDSIRDGWGRGLRRMLVSHPTGTGKGHPLDTEIPTPAGWRKWGELQVGDEVFGSNGHPTTVTGVYDRGILPTFRVTFSDGSSILTDADHLWSVRDQRSRGNSREHRVVSTSDMIDEGLRIGRSLRWRIPTTPISFPDADLPIGPYTLGALIANGYLTGSGTTLTTPDEEVADRIATEHAINLVRLSEPEEWCPRYSLPGLVPAIRALGLNVLSASKFIPDPYLTAGLQQRIALLQGLMDGDGSSRSGGRRSVQYHTTSPRLADNVRELVNSLGGTGSVTRHVRDGYATYVVSILLPPEISPWGTSRKVRTETPRRVFRPRRAVTSIERVEDTEIRCISVDAPDSLYVVGRDYIVTHNTVLFSHMIAAVAGRSLVLVHRDELLNQAADKLRMVMPDADIGIIKAERHETDHRVVIASVQSLHARRLATLTPGEYSLIVCDEAHHSTAPSWRRILEHLGSFDREDVMTLGVTATPDRGDGQALDSVWQEIVHEMSILRAIVDGYLCDVRGQQVGTDADLSRVRLRHGDLIDSEIAVEYQRSGAVAQIAGAYVQYAADRKGVAFMPSVATSRALAEALTARGIKAGHVDGAMPIEERRDVLARLDKGEIQVVSNCAVLVEGWDCPSISCVLVGRPTKSRALYTQQVGRGTRLYPGKKDLLVLDVVGASSRHSLTTLSTLAGTELGGRPMSKAPLLKAARQQAEEEEELERARRTRPVDLFRSRLKWLPVEDGFCLPLGESTLVLAPDRAGTWTVVSTAHGKARVRYQGLNLGYAQGIGEDLARQAGSIADREAYWNRQPPTAAQLNRLRMHGLRDVSRVKTKGQAADLITRVQARRVIRKLRQREAAS